MPKFGGMTIPGKPMNHCEIIPMKAVMVCERYLFTARVRNKLCSRLMHVLEERKSTRGESEAICGIERATLVFLLLFNTSKTIRIRTQHKNIVKYRHFTWNDIYVSWRYIIPRPTSTNKAYHQRACAVKPFHIHYYCTRSIIPKVDLSSPIQRHHASYKF